MADIVTQLKQQFGQLKQQAIQLAQKIGLVKKGPAKPGTAAPGAAAGAKPGTAAAQAKPAKPKFDFNLFIKATQNFWQQFIEVKVPAFFKQPVPYFKNYPNWFKALSKDEMAAHIVVYTGVLFIILGIVFILAV